MEGALASVAGGLVGCPIIAVPTSIGYGSNLSGLTTLLSMISSVRLESPWSTLTQDLRVAM